MPLKKVPELDIRKVLELVEGGSKSSINGQISAGKSLKRSKRRGKKQLTDGRKTYGR